MLKRTFDVVTAMTGLVVLAPMFAVVAVAIKLESQGPVFFRQERVGRHGRPFRIFKFRTMVEPVHGDLQLTLIGDARVTRVGAWLRSSKVDELAQLIDVVRGTMSLVGPRPEVPRFVAHYPSASRERLLSIRPGITDYASIDYRQEHARLALASDPEREYIEAVLPVKVELALRYVDNPALLTDLKLIGLTIWTIAAPPLRSAARADTWVRHVGARLRRRRRATPAEPPSASPATPTPRR